MDTKDFKIDSFIFNNLSKESNILLINDHKSLLKNKITEKILNKYLIERVFDYHQNEWCIKKFFFVKNQGYSLKLNILSINANNFHPSSPIDKYLESSILNQYFLLISMEDHEMEKNDISRIIKFLNYLKSKDAKIEDIKLFTNVQYHSKDFDEQKNSRMHEEMQRIKDSIKLIYDRK